MGDCPVSFSTRFPSSLEFPSMVITQLQAANQWAVFFDHWMDETVTPAMGSFSATIDGAPAAIIGVSWGAANELQLTHALPPAAIDATFNLDVTDVNLRDTDGNIAQAPQSVFNVI